MITAKELQYVDLWASKIPMPGEEYSKQVVEEIKECYETYKQKYQNKEYNLTFSNGEEIDFEIMQFNLCHMLGIDYQNIKSDFFDEYRRNILNIQTQSFTSLDLLESILEHSDKVVKNDNDIKNRAKILNYYKSQIKCNIFKKLSDFEKFNFAAINYNPQDNRYDYDKQKLLFIPSNESVCPYFVMGIKMSEYEKIQKYIVNTLMALQEPKRFFENQEVIIPTQILVSDNNELRKLNASAEEKIQLLTMYKNIINTYNIPNKLNISGDYEAMLNQMALIEQNKKTF